VARLEVQGDSVTEERFVNVSFDDLGGFIPLGELAEVTIKLPSEQNVLVVPTAAVKKIDKTNGVWVVKANKIKFVSVQIGAQTLEGQTHIIKGVEEGDTVVIYSPQLLKEDMEVRVETKS
jgi:multidrug efflux pump subunit AcrA (membrane-fusion protein)